MKKHFIPIVLGCIIIFVSCGLFNCKGEENVYQKQVIEGVKFHDAIDKAKQENKYLWVVIGDTKDTKHTTQFLNELSCNKFFKNHESSFIYYACNIKENEQYWYVLAPQSIPNSYIFNNKGELVSLFEYSSNIMVFVENQLKLFQNWNISNKAIPEGPTIEETKRLKSYNDLIYISNIIYLSNSKDSLLDAKKRLDLIRRDSVNYFIAYLKTQLALKLNDTVTAKKYADSAYEKFNSESNPLLYSKLNDRIKEYSGNYKNEVAYKPILSFAQQKVDCGNIKKREKIKFIVKITNKGSSPLIIYQTRSSCNCVAVDIPKKPILPDECIECILILDVPKIKGKLLKTVYFESNASNRFEKIILEGQII